MEICIKLDQQPPIPIEGIVDLLTTISNNQTLIMSAIDDLKTQITGLQSQVDGLQTALDAEQAQIQQLLDSNAATVTDLNNQITTLQGQIANGATPEQLADVATSLTNISNSIATTRTDLESTIPDQPATGGESAPQV